MALIFVQNDTDGNIGDTYNGANAVVWTIIAKTPEGKNVWENNKNNSGDDAKVQQNCSDILQLQTQIATINQLILALQNLPDSRVICRNNAVQNQPPTDGQSILAEFPDPVDGDTALVVLSNGVTEFWEFDSFWQRSKDFSFGGGSTFDPTNLQTQITAIQNWISNHTDTGSRSFFCRVGNPTSMVPPTSVETGITGTPPIGFQFMIVLPDDTIEIWQYTTNQWELKQTLDFASISALLALRSSTCRTNAIAGVPPTLIEAGTTPPANYVFTVYLADGAQEIWLYNGNGWILKQTITPTVGGDADIGQGVVGKNASTGVITITGTSTAGVTNTVTIAPNDLTLVRNDLACVDELRFCGIATGITLPVVTAEVFVAEDISTTNLACIPECSHILDCATDTYYRKQGISVVIFNGTPEIGRFFGYMKARTFACKYEDNGNTYCNNYVQMYEHTEQCEKVCVGNCNDISWPAIDTSDNSDFTVDWGDGSTNTYASGDAPQHTYATTHTGPIIICFDKCTDYKLAIMSAVTDASYIEPNCGGCN